jgi:circadian clock protein KaiC
LMTAELEDQYNTLRFSETGNAFLADAIIMQRYVEIAGQLRRAISVVKVRASRHSKDICFYTIDEDQISIGEIMSQYDGILSGLPHVRSFLN